MTDVILSVKNLKKTFHSKGTAVKALNDVSFDVKRGETIGIVGESGCGKSTLGRCIVNAHKPTEGEIHFHNKGGGSYELASVGKDQLRKLRRDIQMIFQDPYSSLNPRMTVYDIITEPLKANFKLSKSEMEEKVKDVARKVGLNPSYLKRYPHAFSGGQRQRIGIARALVLLPQLIVCDESVSALDVSVQAQVINLLKELQVEFELTFLFISHDLSVVEYISDRIAVMYLGKIVEYCEADELFIKPLHPYTEALLSAVPIADPKLEASRIPIEGELPDPSNPPSGCKFHTRCRFCEERCRLEEPELYEASSGHHVACHRYEELNLTGIVE